jgi:hypothetical protein
MQDDLANTGPNGSYRCAHCPGRLEHETHPIREPAQTDRNIPFGPAIWDDPLEMPSHMPVSFSGFLVSLSALLLICLLSKGVFQPILALLTRVDWSIGHAHAPAAWFKQTNIFVS